MSALSDALYDYAVVPVIVLGSPDQAEPLGDALIAGGLPVAEVTFRSPAALEGIRRMAQAYPDLLVGAGTVSTTAQAAEAVAAGAKFVVTPGFNPEVVDFCITQGIPIFPGISGTGEIEAAISRGLDVVKFFPAEPLGGTDMLKALSGPYPNLKFMPTGGISLKNLHDYLSLPQVVACGGSWLVSKEALAAGDFARVTRTVADTMRVVYGLSVKGDAIEVAPPFAARTRAYLDRAGVAYTTRDGGVAIEGKSVIIRQ